MSDPMTAPLTQAQTEGLKDEAADLRRNIRMPEYALCFDGIGDDTVRAWASRVAKVLDALPALLAERDALREALEHLANAADAVGIQYFDSDDMAAEPAEMQLATIAARALLGAKP